MAFNRVMRTILCGSVSLIALTGMAAAQTKNLNIPAEDLKVALDTYIRQSGVQLVYTNQAGGQPRSFRRRHRLQAPHGRPRSPSRRPGDGR
jgi:iron complex outermembrane receptor protein